MVQEILTIEVGQAGVQVGNAIWELYCMEHGIRSDGFRVSGADNDGLDCTDVFFQEVSTRFVPRSAKIDLEPSVIDEIKVGAYRGLFNPNFFLSGFNDASSNFARGRYSEGKKQLKAAMSIIRRMAEQSNSLQGVCILNSFDGGTGSGLTTLLQQEISSRFSGKTTRFQLGIYPSRHSLGGSAVCPYNAMFHLSHSLNLTDMSCVTDNESLYAICTDRLAMRAPSYTSINRLVAQLYSNFTVSLRFFNSLNNSLPQVQTNLVPYPRLHYLIASLSPVCSEAVYDRMNMSIAELTSDVFSSDSQFSGADILALQSRYMACMLQYRGDCISAEVVSALHNVRCSTLVKFVDWCPTGFKVGICGQPPASPPGCGLPPVTHRCLTLLANNTAIHTSFQASLHRFDRLFSKRAFVHWFVGEGMEEGEFTSAGDEAKFLIQDYLEMAVNVEDEEPVTQENVNFCESASNCSDSPDHPHLGSGPTGATTTMGTTEYTDYYSDSLGAERAEVVV